MRAFAAALGLVLIGAGSVGAEPAQDPIGEIRFEADPGPMGPRYLRTLGLKVGDRPTRDTLDQAAERLRATFPTLAEVELVRHGPDLDLRLQEQPISSWVLVPIPFVWEVGGIAGLAGLKGLGQVWSGKLEAMYCWDSFRVFDPTQAAYAPLAPRLSDNYGYLKGEWGWLAASDWQLLLSGEGYLSAMSLDPQTTYQPGALTHGPSLTLGPDLRYDGTDDEAFPRTGTRARVGLDWGSSLWGNSADFALYHGEVHRYSPLGPQEALVTALRLGYGRGEIPWHHKFQAGGVYNLRGYDYERFMGDRLMVGTVEYRRKLFADLDAVGMHHVSVIGGTFLDVGRAWESTAGISFPQDVRAGVGGFLALALGSWNVGRVEVALGTEGPTIGITTGLPFEW